MPAEEFRGLVTERACFGSADAMDHGLVDVLGREEDAAGVMEELEGRLRRLAQGGRPPDSHGERWGVPPRIAILYAEGFCFPMNTWPVSCRVDMRAAIVFHCGVPDARRSQTASTRGGDGSSGPRSPSSSGG